MPSTRVPTPSTDGRSGRAPAAARASSTAAKDARRSSVDGVPVLQVAGSGPTEARLLFRVGQADEPLVRRGVTHLVEHLALSGAGRQPHWYNGATGSAVTSFVVVGTSAEVALHLDRVCQALAALPLGRLETERQVLEAEEAQRGGAWLRHMIRTRWGAAGYGLPGYDEVGVPTVTAPEVEDWARTYFTRGNAVLAVRGSLPRGLRLPLPDGPRHPEPPATSRFALPAHSASWDGVGIGLGVVGEDTLANAAVEGVLHDRLVDRIRHQLGLSYGVSAGGSAAPGGRHHTTLYVDALPDTREAAAAAMITVLERLREDGIRDAELRPYRSAARRPLPPARILAEATYAELFGREPERAADLSRRVRAFGSGDLARATDELYASLFLSLPVGTRVPHAVARPADQRVPVVRAPGATVLRADDRTRGLGYTEDELRIDEQRAQAVEGEVARVVRYDGCAAMFRYTNDVRSLLATDGTRITVVPAHWRGARRTAALLDRHVPRETWVDAGGAYDTGEPPPQPRNRVAVVSTLVVAVLLTAAAVAYGVGGSDTSLRLILVIGAATSWTGVLRELRPQWFPERSRR